MPLKKSVVAVITAAALALPAAPALAAPAFDASPKPNPNGEMVATKPVYNKAGVKELLRATSSIKSSTRAAKAAAQIAEQLEAGIEAGTLSGPAELRLVARLEAAQDRSLAAYENGMALAEAANTLHDLREEEIFMSGREAVDSRAWVAAMMAFERALDELGMVEDGSDLIAR